jgi:hypothetical protein
MSDELKPCPECGKELDRREDPHGVSYQCLALDCLSLFGEDEICGDNKSDRGE